MRHFPTVFVIWLAVILHVQHPTTSLIIFFHFKKGGGIIYGKNIYMLYTQSRVDFLQFCETVYNIYASSVHFLQFSRVGH
jgi:hypothetical protein